LRKAIQSQPCLGALTNKVAFKLGKRGKQVKHEFAGGGLGVNLFGEAFKPNAARLQGVDGLDQACEVAPEAVEPPCDEGVACAQGFEAVVEFWAVGVFSEWAKPAKALICQLLRCEYCQWYLQYRKIM
jgi:hypothetical protein